jgi:carboxyvinyl-carboxyphosphonate phosphorylmutase
MRRGVVTETLRERLEEKNILVAPGAYDAFTANLVQVSGFEAVYLSGAGVSYTTLGQPDTGLITQSEMVQRVGSVGNAISIPLIADGDTGYGNAINVMRTVQLYERAGATAIQLEDQQFPKRCGHLSGKEIIPADEMAGKIRAAIDARISADFLIIARTDARGVAGFDEAIRRGKLYLDAGADVLFVEAPQSQEELERVAHEFPGILLMANMVEGGKTPLLDTGELQAMGYSLVIYPNSLTRRFARVALDLLTELKTAGTTRHMLDQMMPFGELNDLLAIGNLQDLERRYLPPPD